MSTVKRYCHPLVFWSKQGFFWGVYWRGEMYECSSWSEAVYRAHGLIREALRT